MATGRFPARGVATGYGPEIFAGSLANGAIYRADLRTAAGALVVPGEAGRLVAAGLSFDRTLGMSSSAPEAPTGPAGGLETISDARAEMA